MRPKTRGRLFQVTPTAKGRKKESQVEVQKVSEHEPSGSGLYPMIQNSPAPTPTQNYMKKVEQNPTSLPALNRNWQQSPPPIKEPPPRNKRNTDDFIDELEQELPRFEYVNKERKTFQHQFRPKNAKNKQRDPGNDLKEEVVDAQSKPQPVSYVPLIQRVQMAREMERRAQGQGYTPSYLKQKL